MLRFQLVSISGKKYDGEVYEVVLPTMDGQIGVMSDHMPLFSVAKAGAVMVRESVHTADSECKYFVINGGAIEISNNSLSLLVDEAERPDEINAAEAQKALERAQKMKDEATDEVSLERAQSMIDRSAVRLQIANLHRHRTK